jgi:hypothetical protein
MITQGLHITAFNDKIKVMNQLNKKDMILTAQEARNLHTDIFTLLNHINDLSMKLEKQQEDQSIDIQVDGGGF